jgi:hypothetical protein
MEYNLNKALNDFEYGKSLGYTDYSYKDLLLLNELEVNPGIPKEKVPELGYPYYGPSSSEPIAVVDACHKYSFNSDGYRSPEFSSDIDLLLSGCSYTVGMGVPEELSWGVSAATFLGLSYNNLAVSGRSAYFTVKNTFAYIKKYGNPKAIFLMLPDFHRGYFPSSPMLLRSTQTVKRSDVNIVKTANISLNDYSYSAIYDTNDGPSMSKRPHLIEEVLSPEAIYFFTLQQIHALEMYCGVAGIDLLWSTWDSGLEKVFESARAENDNYFTGLISLGSVCEKVGCYAGENTHEYCYSIGSDSELGTPHPGLHSHMHWSDIYLEAYKKLQLSK